MLYTKSAAKRILSNAISIERVELVRNRVVLVIYKTMRGRCSTFVSKKLFMEDFVEVRKEASKSVSTVRLIEGVFRARSSDGSTNYEVQLREDGVLCNCQDYKDQLRCFGRAGICKHGYAVIDQWMGLGSLKDYLSVVSNQNAA